MRSDFSLRTKTMKFEEKSERIYISSEHPQSGGKMSKRFGGIIGCKIYTTSSWHLNGSPDDGSNSGSAV